MLVMKTTYIPLIWFIFQLDLGETNHFSHYPVARNYLIKDGAAVGSFSDLEPLHPYHKALPSLLLGRTEDMHSSYGTHQKPASRHSSTKMNAVSYNPKLSFAQELLSLGSPTAKDGRYIGPKNLRSSPASNFPAQTQGRVRQRVVMKTFHLPDGRKKNRVLQPIWNLISAASLLLRKIFEALLDTFQKTLKQIIPFI